LGAKPSHQGPERGAKLHSPLNVDMVIRILEIPCRVECLLGPPLKSSENLISPGQRSEM
jgi:hypothetical protein